MMRPITHEDAFAALDAAALDALPRDEQQAVLSHAAGCAQCGPALAALRETAANLSYAASAVPMDAERSAGVRARLLARAAADKQWSRRGTKRSDITVGQAVPRRWRAAEWVALAAGIAFVAAAALLVRALRDRDTVRDRLVAAMARQTTLGTRVDSLRAALGSEQRLLAAITGAQVRVVDLASSSARPPVGRMFWDQVTNRWTFVAHRLPQLAAGRTYQLWLVTKQAKISAGTFVPDSAGQAVVTAQYPLAQDALQAVAVTEEPAGGVPQPTGSMILVGATTR